MLTVVLDFISWLESSYVLFRVAYRPAFYSTFSIDPLSCWQSSLISCHVHFMFSIVLCSISCWVSSRYSVDSRPGFYSMFSIFLHSAPCLASSLSLFHVDSRTGFVDCVSILVSASVFIAFSTVFYSITFPDNALSPHSVLPALFMPYWSFQLYISLWVSPSAL